MDFEKQLLHVNLQHSKYNLILFVAEQNFSKHLNNSPNVAIIESGNSLIGSISGGVFPFVYTWSSGDSTQIINPMSNGLYWLIVLDSKGCYSDTVFKNVDFVPSSIYNIQNSIILYPNPTDGILNLVNKSEIKISLITPL